MKLLRDGLFIAAMIASGSALFGASPAPVDTLAKLSLEWVNTRAETVRAEADWNGQRELLLSTVKAFEERAHELEVKRDLLKSKTAADREELQDLEIENQRLAEQFKKLETKLKSFDDRLAQLRGQLPPRLSLALDLPLRSLADLKLPPAERMELTITALNRCIQFNRSISFGEEIVVIPGEPKSKLMQTVYWGLSHGYAYDATASKAWFGAPTPEGWKWEPCIESEPAIHELIATFGDKAEPKYVAVPAAAGPMDQTIMTR